MQVRSDPPLHLTYCLNIHPGETWAENLTAIRTHATVVRDKLDWHAPFGLGLRLSALAAEQLADPANLHTLRQTLLDEGMYAFTINGFPYGRFHRTQVKEKVYAPDWRTVERRDYTNRLGEILASLLPEGVCGSISTVPGAYASWITRESDVRAMCERLAETALHLADIEFRIGREVVVALEPEPDCYVETTQQTIDFLRGPLREYGAEHLCGQRVGCSRSDAERLLARHIGLCLDTAHAAVEFEDPASALAACESAGVRIAKIQLSAALQATPTPDTLTRLREFCDEVYLHQVKAKRADGAIVSYADLPEAIGSVGEGGAPDEEWRVHFHVPLFFEDFCGMRSTSGQLLGSFADRLRSGATYHAEIETYTFGVLPDSVRPESVEDCIVREYQWVLGKLLGGRQTETAGMDTDERTAGMR